MHNLEQLEQELLYNEQAKKRLKAAKKLTRLLKRRLLSASTDDVVLVCRIIGECQEKEQNKKVLSAISCLRNDLLKEMFRHHPTEWNIEFLKVLTTEGPDSISRAAKNQFLVTCFEDPVDMCPMAKVASYLTFLNLSVAFGRIFSPQQIVKILKKVKNPPNVLGNVLGERNDWCWLYITPAEVHSKIISEVVSIPTIIEWYGHVLYVDEFLLFPFASFTPFRNSSDDLMIHIIRSIKSRIKHGPIWLELSEESILQRYRSVIPKGTHGEGEVYVLLVSIRTFLSFKLGEVDANILLLETTCTPGSGKLTVTGSPGEVIKESADAAMTYLRWKYESLNFPKRDPSKHDFHIHIAPAAMSKEGPSAGLPLAISLLSVVLAKPVCPGLAMTGEITPRGKVLPVGGIEKKTLAAMNAGINMIILPKHNEIDVVKLPEHFRKLIEFKFVESVDEVLPYVFCE